MNKFREQKVEIRPIDNLNKNFICGMDASEVLAEEKSGVIYYDYEGNEQDIFKTLSESGVNYIRLRVWNDPYDEDGHGYGGANADLKTAIELGKRATAYGMKVCVDFHYSDFWADPNRQLAPKTWMDYSPEKKEAALYQFTIDSLTRIIESGVDVGMVQVGNEINNGMSGEKDVSVVNKLLKEGVRAVRNLAKKYKKDIKVALHYTLIKDAEGIAKIVEKLNQDEVDYDIFGMSYYPMWDGTNENMQNVARNIIENYGKNVIIAETSYCFTTETGDGFKNAFVGDENLVEGYDASVEGQAAIIRDICEAANDAGLIGVFYWGGTWVPVEEYDKNATNADEVLASNREKWEKFGSGWACKCVGDYDEFSKNYGGSEWNNQAMFDFSGHPLQSLKVFKYIRG